MRIESIIARELKMRLKAPFETSFGVTQDRRVVLLEIHTDVGPGWSEVTAMEGPYYNAETIHTAWIMSREFLSGLVLDVDVASPEEIPELMENVRGQEMAKAAIECAAWDAFARSQGKSLSHVLGGTRDVIASGVSLGIQSDTDKLLDKIAKELADGYQRVKLKIKPGKDVAVVAAVRKSFPDIDLTVDANSAYRLEDADLLKELDEFGLSYIEQPLPWNEIYQHSLLQPQLKTAICLDECIHGVRDAEAAIALGACRVINIKLGRVGGHSAARKIQALCLDKSIPVWCGGMLESGVGRAHNIAMSTLPGFVLPGDVSASQRYWVEDIIEPEVNVTPQGTIHVPTSPGIGYRIRLDEVEKRTVRREEWTNRVTVPVSAA
ncbi:MAG: o-succinylbenzoate synthase [Terracidiphilus sp.]|jgi:O-succinylbenzoate synthase